MSLAHQVLLAAKTKIEAALPKLGECEVHDGRFDLAEINAFITRAPAVRLACLGFQDGKDIGDGSEWSHDAMMAAYCVTVDKKGLARGPAVMAIAETVLGVVAGSRFGMDADLVGEAKDPSAANLHSRKAGSRGVTLWAVSWRQPLSIILPDGGSGLVPFETYHSDWDIEPHGETPEALPVENPDATNTVMLEGDQT